MAKILGLAARHPALTSSACLSAVLFSGSAARAAACGDNEAGFQNWLAGFRQEAMQAGISPDVVQSALADVEYDESVISHDRGQRAFHESFEQFSRKKVSAYRIKKGRSLLEHYSGMFRAIERKLLRGSPPLAEHNRI